MLTPATGHRWIADIVLTAGVGMPSGTACAESYAHPSRLRRFVQSMQLAAHVGMAPDTQGA